MDGDDAVFSRNGAHPSAQQEGEEGEQAMIVPSDSASSPRTAARGLGSSACVQSGAASLPQSLLLLASGEAGEAANVAYVNVVHEHPNPASR